MLSITKLTTVQIFECTCGKFNIVTTYTSVNYA